MDYTTFLTPAIIGTGPSFSDILDPVALIANRFCVTLNGAIGLLPGAQAVHFDCYKGLGDNWKFVSPDTLVIMSKRAETQISRPQAWINYPSLRKWLNEHSKQAVHDTAGDDVSVFCAATFLFKERGHKLIELYGIDLNEHRYKNHAKWFKWLTSKGLKLINCCPSSKLKAFPIESRPWTEKQHADTCQV